MKHKKKIVVFGKAGCDKCKILNQRIDKLLEQTDWSDFEKQYCDIETEEGMVLFSETECINPQRIPAMIVMSWDETLSEFTPIEIDTPHSYQSFGKSHLYQYIGIQTDYSEKGRGIISSKMISAILEEARLVPARCERSQAC